MAKDSFANVSHTSWAPSTAYQSIQTLIEQEVGQGLWANQEHTNGWCCIGTSSPYGINNSWITYTYQLISDITQTLSVIWPADWPAPAENINGDLPSHFFAVTYSSAPSSNVMGLDPGSGSGSSVAQPLHEVYEAPTPTSKLIYKTSGLC